MYYAYIFFQGLPLCNKWHIHNEWWYIYIYLYDYILLTISWCITSCCLVNYLTPSRINTLDRNVHFKPGFPIIQSDNKPSQRCGLMSWRCSILGRTLSVRGRRFIRFKRRGSGTTSTLKSGNLTTTRNRVSSYFYLHVVVYFASRRWLKLGKDIKTRSAVSLFINGNQLPKAYRRVPEEGMLEPLWANSFDEL